MPFRKQRVVGGCCIEDHNRPKRIAFTTPGEWVAFPPTLIPPPPSRCYFRKGVLGNRSNSSKQPISKCTDEEDEDFIYGMHLIWLSPPPDIKLRFVIGCPTVDTIVVAACNCACNDASKQYFHTVITRPYRRHVPGRRRGRN